MAFLIQRANQLKAEVNNRQDDLIAQKLEQEESLENMKNACAQGVQNIDDEFDMLIASLVARKKFLKKEYQEICQGEICALDYELTRVGDFIKCISKSNLDMDAYLEQLGK